MRLGPKGLRVKANQINVPTSKAYMSWPYGYDEEAFCTHKTTKFPASRARARCLNKTHMFAVCTEAPCPSRSHNTPCSETHMKVLFVLSWVVIDLLLLFCVFFALIKPRSACISRLAYFSEHPVHGPNPKAAMRCMFATLCMLMLVIYIFSIMFTQLLSDTVT